MASFQHIAYAHIQQAQLTGQVVAVADVEGVLDVAGQALEVAQVGFDFQAQAKPVLLAKISQEVVDLCIELETVRALGHRHQDIQANPHVQQAGDVLGRAVQLLGGQLCAQLAKAQGALVKVFAQWLK